jgi:hypothetical protein
LSTGKFKPIRAYPMLQLEENLSHLFLFFRLLLDFVFLSFFEFDSHFAFNEFARLYFQTMT